MSSESLNRTPIEDLYQEVILDHNRNPRNFRRIEHEGCLHEHAYNPLCGDDYELFLQVSEEKIDDIAFTGKGCAISKSSASMMTKKIKGMKLGEALLTQQNFLKMITQQDLDKEAKEALGSLTIFESVGKFPVRVKCATMIWHALTALVHKANEEIKRGS